MKRKLVIFDVDGTLVSRENVLPAGAKDAIHALRNNGCVTVFFTGRPHSHVLPSVRDLGLDGCICTMGAYIELEGRTVQDLRPDPFVSRELVRLTRECDLDAVFEAEEEISFDDSRPLNEFLGRLKASFASRGFETDKGVDRESFSFSKLCVWSKESSDVVRFEKEASKYLTIIGRKQNMMELVNADVSIEKSVGLLMSHFGVSREDCYAVGDSVNDLPMLRCAGHTAAMGEADDVLKAQVEYVTSGVMEDGIRRFLRHYDLI